MEIAPFPFTEVSELREKYTYNITPWSLGIGVAKKGLRILYSDDEEDDDDDADVAATFGVANIFKASPKTSPVNKPNPKKMVGPSQQNVDKERLTVDISALRQQYKKLRQRQTQAQIILTCKTTSKMSSIFLVKSKCHTVMLFHEFFGNVFVSHILPRIFITFSAAWNKNGILGNENPNQSKNTGVSNASTAMNHLLLGKKPLTTKPRRPAHPGAIPSPKVKRPVTKEESKKKVASAATHYACPQPEVVPPSELKKHKKRKSRKRSPSLEFKKVGDETSSSTEIGGNNDTDQGGSDIDELPNDVPVIQVDKELDQEVSMINLKQSRSSNDIFDEDDKVEEFKNIRSEPDLLKMNGQEQDKKFLEELLEEFDKNSSLSHEEEFIDHGEDDLDEKNEKALQIIKENSEILERLLNKKTTPCNPEQLEPLSKPANNQVQHVQQQQPKRRISHTSSNGSSNGSSVKSSITLQSNPATKPITFNPFPNSARANRKPKEVGRKLGLYK